MPEQALATRHDDDLPVEREERHDASLLSIIERVACNPNVDIERMQALLTMRAEEEERQRRIAREDREEDARREFLTAFSKVQAEIGPIIRSRKNEHTRSTYADLADIERIVTPILTKHGFSTTAVPVPCELDRHIRMRLIIGHAGGHERTYEDDFPLDDAGSQGKVNKTGIQAKGSTQTYARRYLKADALDLSFMDDRDGNAPRRDAGPINRDQLETLRALMTEAKADGAKFCDHFRIDALDSLPASQFETARRMLETKARAAKEGGQ